MGSSTGATPFPKRARSLLPRQCGDHVTQAEQPIAVRAWIVTMSGEDLEVDADAMAWTARAVRIRYMDRFGHIDYAWVWAGAVRRR